MGLDVIRGLAILLAMGYHLNHADAGPFFNLLLRPGVKIGWAGVDLFFVLSGFLIGGMIIREAQSTGGLDYKRFLMRRILRLWPTLYAFLIAMLLFGFPAEDFFWQIALHIQGYAKTKSATHLWSLAVEEQFYLLLGLGFPLLSRTFGWRRTLPGILVGLIVLCPILRALGSKAGFSHWDIYVLTHFRIDALAFDILLSFVALEKPELFDRLLGKRLIWAAVGALGIVFLWNVHKGSRLGEIAGYSVSWITSAAILLLLYRTRVVGPLRVPCRVLAFLGQISYPLYLWHVAALRLGQNTYPPSLGKGVVAC
ncbi:MAG: acyltransferase [Sphingomonadales bacterium]|nr:acyltransferase [Sphingomonadales bacterium]